jgi:hypothetical protein
MIRRFSYILNRFALTDSGTLTIPINLRDTITALWVEFRATNGGSGNKNNPIHSNIQAIELIDGGDILSSVSGAHAFASTIYGLGWVPYTLNVEFPGGTQNLSYCMRFGRYLGDTQYAFDPSKYMNPQVRITWNLGTIRAVGATSYVTATGTLTIYAEIMEGAPNPQGFLQQKQLYQFVTVAAGIQPILLPTDKKIKAIMLRSANVAGGFIYGVGNIKLQGDQSKQVFFDVRDTDLVRYASLRNPFFSYKHYFYCHNGDTIFPLLKTDEAIAGHSDAADRTFSYMNTGAGNGLVAVFSAGVADGTDRNFICQVDGWTPEWCTWIDLGDWGDPSTWLDPSVYKALQLELTQNAAGGVASVVLETENNY